MRSFQSTAAVFRNPSSATSGPSCWPCVPSMLLTPLPRAHLRPPLPTISTHNHHTRTTRTHHACKHIYPLPVCRYSHQPSLSRQQHRCRRACCSPPTAARRRPTSTGTTESKLAIVRTLETMHIDSYIIDNDYQLALQPNPPLPSPALPITSPAGLLIASRSCCRSLSQTTRSVDWPWRGNTREGQCKR